MSAGFLFVSSTPSTSRRQKELNYAAVRSYVSRNAHRKRRHEASYGDDVKVAPSKLLLVSTRPACHGASIPTPLCGDSDPVRQSIGARNSYDKPNYFVWPALPQEMLVAFLHSRHCGLKYSMALDAV